MKINLFFAISAFTLGITSAQAQQLIDENFDAYLVGNLTTDATGATYGQGNWRTQAQLDGKVTDFQITAMTGRGKVLAVKSPDLPTHYENYNNAKFVWKDLPVNGWNNRTQGNNVLKVEYEFFTGNDGATSAAHRHITNAADGTIIAAFQYEPGLRRLRGMTRLNLDGTVKLQFILLAGSQSDLILPANTWVKVCYQINYTTEEITFQIPSAHIDGKIRTASIAEHQPNEVNFVSYLSEWDQVESTTLYDNYVVSAVTDGVPPVVSVDSPVSNKFNLFPNPVGDVLTISNNDGIEVTQISVFDINGRKVFTQNFNRESEIQVNLTDLASGVYVLNMNTNQGTAVKKLIKK
ncbi:T9SS type A sorting domain-containing protein [Flavobacterium sp. JP2137]|uniref:T9SS type A sorting domain-containing protein n=1 Tax=Flavobacterium sp. JP2137 TaxID=3414510 RepID=UPI003D2FCB61